jgi:hypothetical protein
MNFQKVLFAFFILLALTLNFGFYIGDIDNPAHHNVYELFATIVVSLIATILKFGERSHIGSLLLATSLVADLSLIAAATTWGYVNHLSATGLTPGDMASIVSLSGGALLANAVSTILLVIEATSSRR